VTVSYAQTLDGRLATRDGASQWISGGESLHFAHRLRAEHDAIMVGVGTVCKDNPRLTVRLVPGRDPLRVVVDSTLRTPLHVAVLVDGAAHGTLIATTERAPADRCDRLHALGASVVCLPMTDAGQVDLAALLDVLRQRGVGSVMVEGGASLITALLRVRLVDRLAVCIAPKILGAGIEAVGDLGINMLSNMLSLGDAALERYGQDWIVTGDIVYPMEGGADAER
jgi:5-amino-6-(5-phosphoribosylamino)uracil reductase/diaminohydroxyphosphoribosylaminopyrimidine deaminase/5-amino-6-(5-phosphoribosylamino)uracil reductase